jgi:hypothetical protein
MIKFEDCCTRNFVDCSVAVPPNGPPLAPFVWRHCDSLTSKHTMLIKPEDSWSSFWPTASVDCLTGRSWFVKYWQYCKTVGSCVRFEVSMAVCIMGSVTVTTQADHNPNEQLLTFWFFLLVGGNVLILKWRSKFYLIVRSVLLLLLFDICVSLWTMLPRFLQLKGIISSKSISFTFRVCSGNTANFLLLFRHFMKIL